MLDHHCLSMRDELIVDAMWSENGTLTCTKQRYPVRTDGKGVNSFGELFQSVGEFELFLDLLECGECN